MSLTSVPSIEDGIEYWNTQPASLDGVLGGYGSGSLPRIDSLGSRLFLLHLFPELCTVSSSIKPLSNPFPESYRPRALDVGAGIGRVTADVLLHLVSDVVLVEPVGPFVQEALSRGRASTDLGLTLIPSINQPAWPGIADQSKSVTFIQDVLQSFDPRAPHRSTFLDRVGYHPERPLSEIEMGFDVIWCQWCLGHLSDDDLVSFFCRCREALREREKGRSLIVVKENLCWDSASGGPETLFDKTDSSLTRSDKAWKDVFQKAGLKVIRQQVQDGLPGELYDIKMYALR
ncbi:methyltransferase domain-containing protein [Infundibulicybe gibba]|nr:methyltransferase domain-containing protein [Infundibulicybe gibba]